MKTLLLVMLTTFMSCISGTDSDQINLFKSKLSTFKERTETYLVSVEELLSQKFLKSIDFVKNLENSPVIAEIKKMNNNDSCKDHFTILDNFENSHRHGMLFIEIPLRLRIAEIRDRFVELDENVTVAENIVNSKMWDCEFRGMNCTNETEIWLRNRLTNLTCGILKDCKSHFRTKRRSLQCGTSEWYCPSQGYCLNEDSVCDGSCSCSNCEDDTEECFSHCFNGFHCRNLKCVDKLLVCNGDDDCGDNSDESECVYIFANRTISRLSRVPVYGCSKHEFKCKNGQCINKRNVCNGQNTCADGSDETNVCAKHCFEGFHCANLNCINALMICNDVDDCGDGSDESLCPPKHSIEVTCNTRKGSFLCSNQQCIRLDQTCNGHDDCGDGSDEGRNCKTPDCSPDCYSAGGMCLPQPGESLCLNKCPMGRIEVNRTCTAVQFSPSAPISELLAHLSDLLHQYQADYRQFKIKIRQAVIQAESEFIKCKGGKFSLFVANPFVLPLPVSNSRTISAPTPAS